MKNPNAPQWFHDLPVVYVSKEEFRSLREYSCSNPTGTTIGKTWKRNLIAYVPTAKLIDGDDSPIWVLCRYAPHSDPNLVTILRFQLRVMGTRLVARSGKTIAQEGGEQ